VSLINVHVLRTLVAEAPRSTAAGADPESELLERGALSGDNLQVDLAVDEASLPEGSLLEVGTAVLRVSPVVHRPCAHFVDRLGATAAKKVARGLRTGRRGRGVLCEVVRAGEVRVGDRIRVATPEELGLGAGPA
jgi:MOSC domain-containing protein YiiM